MPLESQNPTIIVVSDNHKHAEKRNILETPLTSTLEACNHRNAIHPNASASASASATVVAWGLFRAKQGREDGVCVRGGRTNSYLGGSAEEGRPEQTNSGKERP